MWNRQVVAAARKRGQQGIHGPRPLPGAANRRWMEFRGYPALCWLNLINHSRKYKRKILYYVVLQIEPTYCSHPLAPTPRYTRASLAFISHHSQPHPCPASPPPNSSAPSPYCPSPWFLCPVLRPDLDCNFFIIWTIIALLFVFDN
jgi:hypothetical protein